MPPKSKPTAKATAAAAKPPSDAMRPMVSILTPTYNRRMFLPISIACFKAQTYPQDRMEWIVLDDGSDPVEDLFIASGLKNVKYHRLTEKLPIGAKRNMINELATGDICLAWDDDDYYPADRVRHAVTKLLGNRRTPVVGSTEVFLYFSDRNEIWSAGPYNPNHCTNGTMAYWRTYFRDHKYDPKAEKAEERQFMDDWKTPVTQIRPEECMLVICHPFNTFDKRKLLENKNPRLKKIAIKMRSIVREQWIRDFYLKDLPRYYKELDAAAATTASATGDKLTMSDAEVFGATDFVETMPAVPMGLETEPALPAPTQVPTLLVSEVSPAPVPVHTDQEVPPPPPSLPEDAHN